MTTPWAPVSLRTRLVAVVVVLVAAALALSGLLATSLLRSYLLDQVDRQLADFAASPALVDQLLASGTSDGPQMIPPARPDLPGSTAPQQPPLPSDFYVQLTTDAGDVVSTTSDTFSSATPNLPTLTQAQVVAYGGSPYSVSSADGAAGSWRVLTTPVQGGSVTVARDLSDITATTERLALLLAGVGVAVIVLGAVAAFILVRRSLRPLAQVEAAAGAIAAGDLSRRVPSTDPRTEVGQMSAALNTMLGRLEDAFAARAAALAEARASEEHMRAFVADASHELRTPLTAVSGYAELYRQGAVPPAEVAPTFARIEREAERMSGLVDDLLLLARLDQQRPLARTRVDLLALATADVGLARASHPDRDVQVTALPGTAAPEVVGDEDRLAQVIRNLTTNALRYSDGPVAVAVGAADGTATIQVVDHGPGVPDADKQAIFTRFYRGDAARSRVSGGTGLGLSIVAAIVGAHGGSVAVTDTPGGGTTMTVTLPTRGPATQSQSTRMPVSTPAGLTGSAAASKPAPGGDLV